MKNSVKPFQMLAFGMIIVLTVTFTFGALADSGTTEISPSQSWTIEGDLDGGKDVSGFACATATSCLLVVDEGRAFQMITLDPAAHVLKVGSAIEFLPRFACENSKDDECLEVDAEAVTIQQQNGALSYVVAGSHGFSRKDEDFRESQYFLFRLAVDPLTGQPLVGDGEDSTAESLERTANMRSVLSQLPVVGAYAEMPLQDHGLNIEGIGMFDGEAYFGLRGPSLGGQGFLVRTNLDAVFLSPSTLADIVPLQLGEGLGVRDIASVTDGLLILAGTEQEDRAFSSIFYWSEEAPQGSLLGLIANATGKKGFEGAEALWVLEETVGHYRVLVLFDGVRGGMPQEYIIQKTE